MSGSGLETALVKMAEAVAEKHVRDNTLLGLGSGSTVARFAKALGERCRKESMNVRVVPSSMQSWLLAKENGLKLYEDTARCPATAEVAVDGADQISTKSRAMIKGGGGALFKEKIILSTADHIFVIGDEDKFIKDLKRSVPVEVAQFALNSAERHIRAASSGVEPVLRRLDKGYPYYTESGNVILDCLFKEPISDPRSMEKTLKMIPGVVEVGIFTCAVDLFYKANHDGTFESF